MTDSPQNDLYTNRLQTLMSRVEEGHISIEGLFPEKRLYKALAVFGNDEGTIFMLIGEHKNAFAIFEASQYNEWSFHSAHSSLEGALNEMRDFRLKRIS
jgi:hypothetical protein